MNSIYLAVVCDSRNWLSHAKELGNATSGDPWFFLKPGSALVLPGTPVEYPPHSKDFQWEVEGLYRPHYWSMLSSPLLR